MKSWIHTGITIIWPGAPGAPTGPSRPDRPGFPRVPGGPISNCSDDFLNRINNQIYQYKTM